MLAFRALEGSLRVMANESGDAGVKDAVQTRIPRVGRESASHGQRNRENSENPKLSFASGEKEWPFPGVARKCQTLRRELPHGFEHLTDADLKTEIAEQLLAEESSKAREAVFDSGREFCGFQDAAQAITLCKGKE